MCFLSELAFRVPGKRDEHSSRSLSCPYLRAIESGGISQYPSLGDGNSRRAHARGSSSLLRSATFLYAPPGVPRKSSTPPSGNPARLQASSDSVIFRATIPRSRGYALGVTRPRPAAGAFDANRRRRRRRGRRRSHFATSNSPKRAHGRSAAISGSSPRHFAYPTDRNHRQLIIKGARGYRRMYR